MEIKLLDNLTHNKNFTGLNLIPEYATAGSAAMDLRACIDESFILRPGKVSMIPTGIAIHINNRRLVGLIYPRSGLGSKRGLVLANGTGVIDSDYVNEIMVALLNRSDEDQVIIPGDRIAQMMFVPVSQQTFTVVDNFTYSHIEERTGGFGSSGVR